jgi:prolyl oligopeptidase PreP (S9A serine peptidase family)
MRRYTKLTAGSSWTSEYGDPDNAQLAFNIALGFAFLRKTIAPEMVPAS